MACELLAADHMVGEQPEDVRDIVYNGALWCGGPAVEGCRTGRID